MYSYWLKSKTECHQVAFIPELPEQYACYRKAHQVARWHLI